MHRLLILTLGAGLAVGGCGTAASDAGDAPLEPGTATSAATATDPARTRRPAPPFTTRRASSHDVTIPDGTSLPLSLTSSLASDTSAVEDTVSAELTRAVTIDGREVLPAGTQVTGIVTGADDSNRVKGRANVTFVFTTLRLDGTRYDVTTAPLSHTAAGTKSEDATKIGIGAGAGAIIGGLLGGKDGAAKGAAVGGGAGAGVVLATKGKEVRLGPGADVTTRITAPLTVRVLGS